MPRAAPRLHVGMVVQSAASTSTSTRLRWRCRRAVDVTRGVVRGLFADHAFDHAATMAFYFFLGAIPMLVVLGLLVGNVVQREGAEALAEPLLHRLPRVASDRVREELDAVARADARAIAPLGLIGFIWLTTNGVHNLMDVFEQLVGAAPRRWWRQRAIAVLWVIAVVAALGAATWLVLFLNDAALGAQSVNGIPSLFRRASALLAHGWQRVGALAVFFVMSTVALAAFYRTATLRSRGVRSRVWPGAFVAIVVWAFVSWGFAAYVATIADYAVYYGGLAAIAVILLWLYLTSLALLVGAEVNAQLERAHDVREIEVPRSRRGLAQKVGDWSRAFARGRRDAAFFDGLACQAMLNVRAADVLHAMVARMTPASASTAHPYRTMADRPRTELDEQLVTLATDIKAIEGDGDRLKHEAMKRVRANWMTPLDREDIRGLVHGMDDVLDRIDAVAERIVVYRVSVVTEEAVELVRLLMMSCEALMVAVRSLQTLKAKQAADILERCAEVNRIETAADAVHRRAMGLLFLAGNDPLLVMKWRDLYDGLEAATDACEDVADIAEGVVLEYA